MADTDRNGTAVATAIVVAAVGVHLLVGAATVLAATRWIGWTAIGVAAAIVLHVVSARRVAARRRTLQAGTAVARERQERRPT